MAKQPKRRAASKALEAAPAAGKGKTAIGTLDRPAGFGNAKMGWVSDIMAETVRRLGIEYIVLVPGASYRGFHDSIVNYLGNDDPQMVICLHEEHAIAIAEGYTKVSGKIAAAAVHANVGLMHSIMAIFNCWSDRSPIVIFGANGPIDAHNRRPWIDWIHTTKDNAQMFRNFIKWDDEPQSAQAAIESILRGHQIALTPPMGPVYICLDAGLQEQPLADDVVIPDVSRYGPGAAPAASTATIKKTIAAIKKAKFPLFLMGRGSRDRGAFDRRVRLAEAFGAAVYSSTREGVMFPTEHPLHVAPPGGRPLPQTIDLVKKADLIVSLGWVDVAGFLRLCTKDVQTQNPTSSDVIHVSLESYLANGWNMDYQALPAVDQRINADPDTFVQQMLDELGVKVGDKKKMSVKPAVAKIKHWAKDIDKVKPKKGSPMMGDDLTLVVRDFIKKQGKNKVCLARAWNVPPAAARFDDPLDYIGSDGGGGVGSAPGHAVGAALALKGTGRMCLAVMGDGNYTMGVNALWTASRMDLPMMIVIANNHSFYNDEAHQYHLAVMRDRPPENSWIGLQIGQPAPDMVKLAEGQGFEGEQVDSTEGLAAALERGAKIVNNGGRYLIDAIIEPDDAMARRAQDGGRKQK